GDGKYADLRFATSIFTTTPFRGGFLFAKQHMATDLHCLPADGFSYYRRENCKMIHRIPLALTVAGTDPTGGAGIQAALKSFPERTGYGMRVITSVVAQNQTTLQAVQHMPDPFIKKQLNHVFSDVRPLVDNTVILEHPLMIHNIAAFMHKHKVRNLIQPVIVANIGHHLIVQTPKYVSTD